jgi:DNA-binding NarL/FixJ family response regulator
MGIRTIVVDDESLARDRLRAMLAVNEKIEIIDEASNGDEAIEKIRSLNPDLVFLDVEMPGPNGFQVVQSLQQQPFPKIIFVTAYDRYAIQAFELGAIDYLLKPVRKTRLLEAVERAAGRKDGGDMAIAREVQKRLLPDRDLQTPYLEFAGASLSLNDVGGDYYDFVKHSPERFGIFLADVSGKGFSAALMMAHLQAALRLLTEEPREPVDVLTRVNQLFYENSVPEMYATVFYGLYDNTQKLFTFCNAGHNPPLFFHSDRVDRLACGGTIVGMFPGSRYEQESVSVNPGDTIVAYSDGLVELTDAAGEELGEERLVEWLKPNLSFSAQDQKRLLLEKIGELADAGSRHDDLTLVILKAV